MAKDNTLMIIIGIALIVAVVFYLPKITQFSLLPSGEYRNNSGCSFITNVPAGQPYQQAGAYVSINGIAYGSTGEVTNFICDNNSQATTLSVRTLEGYPICTNPAYPSRIYIQQENYGRIFETGSVPSGAITSCPVVVSQCTADNQCVKSSCCHATSCVPILAAPSCNGIFCSSDCSSPLDCGAGHCGCVNNQCAIVNTGCVENWQTGSWSSCISGTQNRTATDLNSCGTINNKPATQQSCSASATQQDVITASGQWINKQITLNQLIAIAKQWLGI